MGTTNAAFDEQACLSYYLFEGDFGDPADRELSDVIRTSRTPKQCVECLNPITKGSRYRCHTGVYDGTLRTYRFCQDCCAAMAKTTQNDNDDADESDQDTATPMQERAKVRVANISAGVHLHE